jgi:hypothetical protein
MMMAMNQRKMVMMEEMMAMENLKDNFLLKG